MLLIEKQSFEYAFYWAGEQPPPSRLHATHDTGQVGFGSNQQAQLFLRSFSELYAFRMLLQQRFPGQVHRWRINDITEKMADLMVRKRLLVLKRWVRAEGPSRVERTSTIVPRKGEVVRDQQWEPATFPSNNDADAQAEALQNAAANGDSFCEECEKARLALQPAPPEPEEEASNDNEEQVKALTAAAASGAAFCEECEKQLAALSAAQPPMEEEELPAQDTQAAALTAAAESGVPFCEECEKQLAALHNAVSESSPAEPEPRQMSENHDQDAQAATLLTAAESGVPFCEECEKAKAAAAAGA